MGAYLREGQDVRRVWYRFALYPPPGVSAEEDVVKRIRTELMPDFCPLWLTRVWEYPTGRRFETVHVVIARMEIHPPNGARIVKGLPMGPRGEKYRIIDIVNGLSNEEVSQGFIGRYQPLVEMFEAVKQGLSEFRAQKDFQDAAIEIAEAERADDAEKEADKKRMKATLAGRIRDDKYQLGALLGRSATVYVSTALSKLRKAAGRAYQRSPKNHAAMPRGGGNQPARTAESRAQEGT